MSFRNEYILNVDVKRRMTSIVPTFKQGDSATLKFKIFDDGKEFDLTDFTRSEITFRLPSGQTIVGEPFLDANTKMIVYHFVGVEMSEVGKLETILSIYSGTSMVSIQPFSVWIFDHLKDKDLSYIGILQDLIAEVELLKVDVKNTLDEANQIKDDLDELLVETEASETLRNTNELERITNENTRKSNETDRKSSEDTRKSNETTRIQNEQTRNANEQIRQQSLSDMNTIINQYKFTGTYKTNVTYKKFNQVEFEGSTYIALVDNTNTPVSDTNTWRIFAQRGLKGDKGDTGAALSILGKLTDASQLPPTGQAGDAYTVNGELYVWSEVTGEWENVGNIKGEKGDKGDSGEDGESAYEVAVHNGFVGTSEEWLASLKGEKGDTGDLTEINKKVDGIQTSLTTHTGNSEIHVLKPQKDKWDKALQPNTYDGSSIIRNLGEGYAERVLPVTGWKNNNIKSEMLEITIPTDKEIDGILELTITSTFANSDATGGATVRYNLTANVGIIHRQVQEITNITEYFANQFYVDKMIVENNMFRIRLFKRSASNPIRVHVEYTTWRGNAFDVLNSIQQNTYELNGLIDTNLYPIQRSLALPPPINAVLGTGWINNDNNNPLTYYKDPFGIVHIYGRVKVSSAVSSLFTTMPVGYRPVKDMTVACLAGAATFTSIEITTNGEMHSYFVKAVNDTVVVNASYRTT